MEMEEVLACQQSNGRQIKGWEDGGGGSGGAMQRSRSRPMLCHLLPPCGSPSNKKGTCNLTQTEVHKPKPVPPTQAQSGTGSNMNVVGGVCEERVCVPKQTAEGETHYLFNNMRICHLCTLHS